MLYLTFISCFFSFWTNPVNTDTLYIEVQNIENTKGMIAVALYNSTDTFCDDDAFIIAERYPIEQAGTVFIEIPAIAYDTYAIAVYHDTNDNKVLDKSIFGIPREPYGFSNKVNSKWSPPNFEDAKFDFNKNTPSQKVVLKYWKNN